MRLTIALPAVVCLQQKKSKRQTRTRRKHETRSTRLVTQRCLWIGTRRFGPELEQITAGGALQAAQGIAQEGY